VHVSCVAQCDGNVSQVAASLGALDGSPLEALIESLGCESQFLGQRWKRGFRVKSRVALGRKAIPRADHLADVASENPVSDLFTQFNGDVILEFDGEIGDTSCCVECAIGEDAIGGTGFDTTCAGAAMVGNERWVGLEFKVKKYF